MKSLAAVAHSIRSAGGDRREAAAPSAKNWSGRVDSNHRPLGPEPTHLSVFSEQCRDSSGSGNRRVTTRPQSIPGFTAHHRSSTASTSKASQRVWRRVRHASATELRHDSEALARHAVRSNVRISTNQLRHGSEILESRIQAGGLLVVAPSILWRPAWLISSTVYRTLDRLVRLRRPRRPKHS
jgi:hypothetical protein